MIFKSQHKRNGAVGACAAATAAILTLGLIALQSCAPGGTRAVVSEAAADQGAPDPERGIPGYELAAIDGPLRIGIQAGHWKIAELPDELARLRNNTGAAFGDLAEVDLNLAVSRLLVQRLASEGYAAELIPAAVPEGYRADLFISIHADRADQPARAGWKLAPPWRPSPRSRELAKSLASAFRASGLVEDVGGVTANMRGYFGFSWWRFDSTLSPYTPAALIEMGFLGNEADRKRMRDEPALYADIIMNGVRSFLSDYKRDDLDALVPTIYPSRWVGDNGAAARASPSTDSPILERYDAGRFLRPVDSDGRGWFEFYSRPLRRGVWIHESELG